MHGKKPDPDRQTNIETDRKRSVGSAPEVEISIAVAEGTVGIQACFEQQEMGENCKMWPGQQLSLIHI